MFTEVVTVVILLHYLIIDISICQIYLNLYKENEGI